MTRKLSVATLFALLAAWSLAAPASTPFGNEVALWSQHGGDDFGNQVAVAKGAAIVAVGDDRNECVHDKACFTPGVFVFEKINGSWTEVAFLRAKTTVASVAISNLGDVILAGDGTVIDVYQEPAGGWADAEPTAKLGLPGQPASTIVGQVTVNGSQVMGEFYDTACGMACGQLAVFVEPGSAWADSFVPNTIVAEAAFTPQLKNGATLSADTIASGAVGEVVEAITRSTADWSGTPNIFSVTAPASFTGCFGKLTGFAGSALAVAGAACGGATEPYSIALLQQSGADWNAPTLLATLSTSDSVSGALVSQLDASSKTVGLATCDPSRFQSTNIYLFKKGAAWADGNEIQKLTGLGPESNTPCSSYPHGKRYVGFSVSDSVVVVNLNKEAQVFDSASIQPAVDLRTILTIDNQKDAPAGMPFKFLVGAVNDDKTLTATGVSVTGTIPAALPHVKLVGAQGVCTLSSTQLNCSFGDLPPGQSAQATLSAVGPAAGTQMSQTASVTSTTNVHSLRDTQATLAYGAYAPPVAQDVAAKAQGTDNLAQTPVYGSFKATDPNGRGLLYKLMSAPEHGTAYVLKGSNFVYYADSLFIGTDSFTYEAYDGFVNSRPAKVAITVVSPNTNHGCSGNCGPKVNPVSNAGGGLDLLSISVLGLLLFARRRYGR